MDEPEVVVDVARGDTELSREVVAALGSIAGAVDDPVLRNLVDQVAAGRLGVRELAGTDAFSAVLDTFVAPVLTALEETSYDEFLRRQSGAR